MEEKKRKSMLTAALVLQKAGPRQAGIISEQGADVQTQRLLQREKKKHICRGKNRLLSFLLQFHGSEELSRCPSSYQDGMKGSD